MTRHQIKEYCEAEFENINAVTSELFSIIKTEKTEYSIAELAAIGTFIHNCYNGIENILKRILLASKIKVKDTPTWHKDLLKTSLDMGVISYELYVSLSGYLSFRHFFIHAYGFSLRWEELKPLIDGLEETLNKFKSTIYHYIDVHD